MFVSNVWCEFDRASKNNTNLVTLVSCMGYPHITLPGMRGRRTEFRTCWTMAKKFKLFVDYPGRLLKRPIIMLSVMGLTAATLAFIRTAFAGRSRLCHRTPVQGWASLLVLTAFAAGRQLAMLGMLGKYVWRPLDEIRRCPSYVIDGVYDDRPSAT